MVFRHPSEKYEFVNGKDYPFFIMENKIHVWNHQPVMGVCGSTPSLEWSKFRVSTLQEFIIPRNVAEK